MLKRRKAIENCIVRWNQYYFPNTTNRSEKWKNEKYDYMMNTNSTLIIFFVIPIIQFIFGLNSKENNINSFREHPMMVFTILELVNLVQLDCELCIYVQIIILGVIQCGKSHYYYLFIIIFIVNLETSKLIFVSLNQMKLIRWPMSNDHILASSFFSVNIIPYTTIVCLNKIACLQSVSSRMAFTRKPYVSICLWNWHILLFYCKN